MLKSKISKLVFTISINNKQLLKVFIYFVKLHSNFSHLFYILYHNSYKFISETVTMKIIGKN